jgi:hypothetical protein
MLIFFKWKEQAIIKLISLSLVTIFFQSQLDAFNNFNLDYIQSLFFFRLSSSHFNSLFLDFQLFIKT